MELLTSLSNPEAHVTYLELTLQRACLHHHHQRHSSMASIYHHSAQPVLGMRPQHSTHQKVHIYMYIYVGVIELSPGRLECLILLYLSFQTFTDLI